MGLNIREIVSRKEIEISKLKGKTLSVDAFNTLYQFISTIRQYDGSPLLDEEGNITSHLSGIFYRSVALLSEGVKLIYVFDGEAPKLKKKTHEKRQNLREIMKEKYEEAKASEDTEGMKKYSSQLIRLNDEMIEESKELLQALGVQVVNAPGEGEAQASYMCAQKKVYACVSQDYDSLLFGSPVLIRNLTISRKKKTVSGYVEVLPEIIEIDSVLKELKINLDQFICLGIMVGTDYNPKGIPRIGQKKALEIVRKYEKPEEIFSSIKEKIEELNEEDYFDWKEIFNLIKTPNVKDVEVEIPSFDFEKVREILVERHGFNKERVDKQLERLEGIRKAKQQKGLGSWI